VIPAPKRLVVRIPIMPLHHRRKCTPADRFKKSSKDAIFVPHARFTS
jgi:hypothetical protein